MIPAAVRPTRLQHSSLFSVRLMNQLANLNLGGLLLNLNVLRFLARQLS